MKEYVKPMIVFESFALSQGIAACAFDMANSTTVEQCSAEGDDLSVFPGISFFTDLSICDYLLEDTEYETFCYTNGVNDGGNIQLFNS